MTAEQLFKRNLEWAYSMKYDLNRIHSPAVVDMLNKTADHLLLDAQTLSIGLRTAAAYHEDRGTVQIANASQRSKFIVEFNLLVTNVGSGKSTMINSLIDIAGVKRTYDCRRSTTGSKVKDDVKYRHGTVQEFTGPGILKALAQTGNLFIVIDEFDGNHYQSAMFPSDLKNPNNTVTSANAVMKSLHTGMTTYQKAKASDNGCVKDPHTCFLGASNGAPILDILRYKIKNPNIADAMVMRTIFDAVKSPPKFNSIYAKMHMPANAIGWELFVLASSLLTNQTYLFDDKSSPSTNTIMLNYMDTIIAAASRWDGIDPWASSRFAKTCELAARLAAQLTHIDLTMALLEQFIHDNNVVDCNASVSYERYCSLQDFFYSRYPPSGSIVTITDRQVEAAIYVTDMTLLKYFNLFDTDLTRNAPVVDVPFVPPAGVSVVNNATGISLPSTQGTELISLKGKTECDLKQLILTFQSVVFTRTMLYKIPKLRSKNDMLDSLLDELVASNLLLKFDRAVSAGTSRADVYVKCLPSSLTQNTTNEWVMHVLDSVKLSWPTYVASCSTIVFPSVSSVFSDSVKELLETDPYKQLVTAQVKPSRNTLKKKKAGLVVDPAAIKTIADNNDENKSPSCSIVDDTDGKKSPACSIDDHPTAIDLLPQFPPTTEQNSSPSVIIAPSSVLPSISDASFVKDSSILVNSSNNPMSSIEQTVHTLVSILPTLTPSQQQQLIMHQLGHVLSQSIASPSSLRSSIIPVGTTSSVNSAPLTPINANLPSPRPPPLKVPPSSITEYNTEIDVSLSEDHREMAEDSDEQEKDNDQHNNDYDGNPGAHQLLAIRKSNRPTKTPKRCYSPDGCASSKPSKTVKAKPK